MVTASLMPVNAIRVGRENIATSSNVTVDATNMDSAKMERVFVSLVGMESIVLWRDVQTVAHLMDSVDLTLTVPGNADVTAVGTEETVAFCLNKDAMMDEITTKVSKFFFLLYLFHLEVGNSIGCYNF